MVSNISSIDLQIQDFRIRLGDKIRDIREQRGYSQEQLADMMHINRTTISKIEKGKFGITIDYLVQLSILLDHEFRVIER